MDLLGGLREADQPAPDQRPRRRSPPVDRRVLLLAFALVPVLAVLAVVALLPGGPDEPAAGTSPDAVASTAAAKEPAGGSAGAATTPSASAGALQQLPPDEVGELLDGAGVEAGGDVAGGWAWADRNGRNALVTASAAGSDPGSYDLRVTHVAGLDGTAEVLRVMREPGIPRCDDGAGTAGFTPQSVTVRDLDGDGVGEVSIGWAFRCGAAGTRSDAKLVLLADGKKFILRGRGVIGRAGSGGFVPDPARRSWPPQYLDSLTEQFHQLYY